MEQSRWALALLVTSLLNPARADEVTLAIRLNTVGYVPQAEKRATIATPCTTFAVVQLPGGQKVFSGRVTGPVLNPDTREQLYTANFSNCEKPGDYELEIPGVGRSAPFRIARDVYSEPFSTTMLGMYLWRCGTAVSATYHNQTFAHGPCHTNDGWLDFVGGGHTQKDGTEGWHDAGDYNKYTVNAGVAVGTMFRAWEDFGPQIRRIRLQIPESGGPLPDFLAELKWEMDWVLKMQAPDGSVYHKLSAQKFGGFIPPDAEITPRYFTPWGSEATADFVGMTAQAARLFRPYDPAFADRCLQAASKSYAFLTAHPEYHRADQAGFRTGAYEANEPDRRLGGVPNNRLWSAAELWETTGAPDVLQDLENRIRATHARVNPDFDWEEVMDLGLLTYASSHRPGRDPALLKQVCDNLVAAADGIVQSCNHHGYARPLGSTYYWGCNGGVARQTMLLMAADRLVRADSPATGLGGAQPLIQPAARPSAKPEYRAATLDALNYLLGRNCYGRSFVTGIGFDPPMHPHDRRCGDGKGPWPGYLVGGPHPGPADWYDAQAAFASNEIAINWNAALIYALAACLD
ncbi:MAG: glycoside hydrolase family 9 protein [Verrucomicrobiota bacterium]|jgi:endoglucanase